MRGLMISLVVVWAMTGCASSEGPEFLVITPELYHEAFDAAADATRAASMPPTLRDRRGGVIETEHRIAGSILEPWRTDNASFSQAMENTISFQRRRVRVEFTPSGFDPTAGDLDDPLMGPDLLGLEGPAFDLTRHEGDIELRVWVYLERSSTYGVRRSAWTQRVRRQMQIISTETGDALQAEASRPRDWTERHWTDSDRSRPIRPSVWTPVTRDPAFERRLLEEIRKRLENTG